MADKGFFSKLQRRPVIINSSRGGVVDEQVLLQAMNSGQVSSCIIDTWEGEPDLNRQLLDKAIIATPHIAGYSADGKANATRMVLATVGRFLGKSIEANVAAPELPAGYSYGSENDGCLRLYDPRVDSQRLKIRPEDFELLRGTYPLRREK
jgi:erythronate-4-phosphate dehydrogenase